MMFDKMIEKILESNEFFSLLNVQGLTENRKRELESIKNKIRTSPQEVEEWFDKEIAKLSNTNNSGIRDTVHDTLKKSRDV